MLDWLSSPLSGATQHAIAPWVMWHARCMVLGWGVLLPLGALLARYFKVLPKQNWPTELDNKLWWHGHQALQWAGVLVMSVGVGLAWGQGGGANAAAQWHALGGWALVLLGWLQVAAALARGSKGGPSDPKAPDLRGDHYDMSPRRIWFERWHKGLGWLVLLAAWGLIALGLFLVDAPRWMALTLAAWWLALAGAAWHWQRAGRCIDTYQAIWGPDPIHPGNRRPHADSGLRRPRFLSPSHGPTQVPSQSTSQSQTHSKTRSPIQP
jgi:hypothetical protein